jgi:hypothetical protein
MSDAQSPVKPRHEMTADEELERPLPAWKRPGIAFAPLEAEEAHHGRVERLIDAIRL